MQNSDFVQNIRARKLNSAFPACILCYFMNKLLCEILSAQEGKVQTFIYEQFCLDVETTLNPAYPCISCQF